MKTQAFVIADDPVYPGWLEHAAGANLDVKPIAAREPEAVLIRFGSERRVDIVFCEFDSRNLAQRVQLVERLLERHPQLPVVGLGASDNADLVLAAMRAGARDFFVLRRDDATLGVQIARLLRRSAAGAASAVASPQKPGRVYGMLSAHPHDSIAFVAEHLALALTEAQPNQRVLLMDLATPTGAAAIFLNLAQTYSVLDAINDAHRCDETLVDTAFTRHTSGLYVLSLPEDLLGRPHIDGEELLRLLRVLSSLFAHIVVTVDGLLPLKTLTGFVNQVDRLLLLSDQSIMKSRHNKYMLRVLRQEGCSLDRAGLVVDNYRRRLGLEPANLAELFDLPLLIALQSDSFARVTAMNSGEPIYAVSQKDPFWLGIKQLAEMLMAGQAVAKPPVLGLLKRLLG
ncbi:MAG: hypothetical protein JWR16_2047 [Nevskia sp.]|nr:hypothetical protein [Nevskia sp.]